MKMPLKRTKGFLFTQGDRRLLIPVPSGAQPRWCSRQESRFLWLRPRGGWQPLPAVSRPQGSQVGNPASACALRPLPLRSASPFPSELRCDGSALIAPHIPMLGQAPRPGPRRLPVSPVCAAPFPALSPRFSVEGGGRARRKGQ